MMGDTRIITRLEARLGSVVDGLVALTGELPIRRFDSDGVFIGFPSYYWGDVSAQQRAAQVAVKREYEPFSDLLRILLGCAPEDLVRQLEAADESFRTWVELGSNWSLTPEPAANEEALRGAASELLKILEVLEATGASSCTVVPDTSSLLSTSDPVAYRSVVQSESFTFALLPTVLGELDHLKIEHRNPDVRDKAKAAISRIKGWRLQGSLGSGVTVDKSIIVRAWHAEPDMKSTLPWLDATVPDDRIIASVLGIQAAQPADRLVLVTADINLMNKADAALVEAVEPPGRANQDIRSVRRGTR
jgi:hypothetical protein